MLEADLTKEGANFASDLALFGARLDNSQLPITGRATMGVLRYGLVQQSVTDLLVRDPVAADYSALARVSAMQPAPRRVTVNPSEGAAYDLPDLIPGRRMDTRLYESLDCGTVDAIMRLQQVDVAVSGSEAVTEQLIPLGVEDA